MPPQLGPITPIIVTGGKPPVSVTGTSSQITINSQNITFRVDVGQDDAWTESENVNSVVNVNQIVYGSQEYTPQASDHPISIEFKNNSGHLFTVAENNQTTQTIVDISVNGSSNHFQATDSLPNDQWKASAYSDVNTNFYSVEVKDGTGKILATLEGGDANVTIYVEEPGT